MSYPTHAESLPEYQSHRVVRAMKIAAIQWSEGGAQLLTADADPIPRRINVDLDYMIKHRPKVGGYYIAYDDGYESWSPSEAFEAGYSRL